MRYPGRKRKPGIDPAEIGYRILLAAVLVFLLYYIFKASVDVVWSDYIRLIDSYLPDVTNIRKFLVPDVLTRIPAAYLGRIINVRAFRYSVMFDRVLTVTGIGLMGYALVQFSLRQRLKFPFFLLMMIVLASLNKWEVLLNGTAWPHAMAIGLFFVNYLIFDRIWTGESGATHELAACVFPFLMLFIAGDYIAGYAVTMILVSLYGAATGGAADFDTGHQQNVFIRVTLSTVAALLLYLLSRHFAVYEHAGATDMSIFDLLKTAPSFFPRFFLKSLAGDVWDAEMIAAHSISDEALFATGALVFLMYIICFIVYFALGLNEKSIFPLLLLVSGFANHGIVMAGRWIFLNENYGISSRYGIQFSIGIFGMIAVMALYKAPKSNYRERKLAKMRNLGRAVVYFGLALICAGTILTGVSEWNKAQYRKENYRHMAEMILDYENQDTEELKSALEWHKDEETMLNALKTIKDNKLNVFRPSLNTGGTIDGFFSKTETP